MSCKISILVACYNAEKYLQATLDSLTGQTLKEIEILCIDDASSDNTWAILKDNATRDPRIIPIQLTTNQGPSTARSIGLEQACGQLVGLVDSDDWLSEDALEKAWQVKEAHPATEIVLFQMERVFEDRHEPFDTSSLPDPIPPQEAFFLSLDWQIHGYFLADTDFHKRYPYRITRNCYSDETVTRIHFLQACQIRFCHGIYYYRQNPESITHRFHPGRFDHLEAHYELTEFIHSSNLSHRFLNQWETIRWNTFVERYNYFLNHRKQIDPAQQRTILDRFRKIFDTIDPTFILNDEKKRFGHYPFPSFTICRRQWMVYYYLQQIYRRAFKRSSKK